MKPNAFKQRRQRRKVVRTRHGLNINGHFIKLSGITAARQYAKLLDFTRDARKATALQMQFLAGLTKQQRSMAWTPERIVVDI